MELLERRIRELQDPELPPSLHSRIMRRLTLARFQRAFWAVASVLLLNLAVSGWYLWKQLIETDAVATIRFLLEDSSWSLVGTRELISVAREFFPVGLLASFALNAAIIVYVGYLFRSFRKLSHRGRTAAP